MSTAPRIRIDKQGNVGIGTTATAPLQRLHVGGNLAIDAAHAFKVGGANVLTATALASTVVSSNLQTVGNLSSLNVTTGNVNFGNTLTKHSAFVGINSSTPSYTLDVSGTVNVTGNYRVNGNVFPEVSTSTYDGYIPSNFGDPVDMFPADTHDTTAITGLSGAGDKYEAASWRPTARSTAFLPTQRVS